MSTLASAPAAPIRDASLDLNFDLLLRASPEVFPYSYSDPSSSEMRPLRSWEHLQVLLSRLGSSADLAYLIVQRIDSGRCAQVIGSPQEMACELLPGDSQVLAVVAPGRRPPARFPGPDGGLVEIDAGEALTAAEALAVMRPWLERGDLPVELWSLREVIY